MSDEPYDSTNDTLDHIAAVRLNLAAVVVELENRAREHDLSKLEEPEKSVFDRVTPELAALTYGSPEYKASLASMGPALQHHYKANRHHPEHFDGGLLGMSLVDVVEMLCDWRAAGQRHDPPNDIADSIEFNQARFGYSNDIKALLLNTARDFGWLS